MTEELIDVGVNFIALLTIILVVAKKLGYITLSWWFVLSPVIALAILVGVLVIQLVVFYFD